MDETDEQRIASAVGFLMAHGKSDEAAAVSRLWRARDDAEKERRRSKQVLYTERGEKVELYRDVVKRLEEHPPANGEHGGDG